MRSPAWESPNSWAPGSRPPGGTLPASWPPAWSSIALQESARGFALQRRVSKPVLAIGPQHKVDEPVAEAAHAIEKQDRLPVFRFTVGRVVHRHASFTGPIPLPHRAGYRAQVLFSRTDWVS